MAVSAFYKDATLADEVEITARWHTKLTMAGKAEDGFDVSIVEGINRLVFQSPELTSEGRAERSLPELPTGLAALVLRRGGLVRVPSLEATFELDHEEETDGPLNVYWGVVRV